MQIAYSISADDYVRANRTHCSLLFRSWRGWICPTLTGVLCSLIIANDLDLPPIWLGLTVLLLSVGIAFGMWVFLVVLNRALLPRRARKIYQQTQALQEEYEMSWDGQSLRLKSDRSDQRLPWTDFNKWVRTSNGLLLYVSDIMFYILPSRYIDPHRETIVDALERHGVPQWQAWRSLPKKP